MTANCVPVTSRDNLASNGVIHTVEKVLKPVTETLLDIVQSRPELTTLKTGTFYFVKHIFKKFLILLEY